MSSGPAAAITNNVSYGHHILDLALNRADQGESHATVETSRPGSILANRHHICYGPGTGGSEAGLHISSLPCSNRN